MKANANNISYLVGQVKEKDSQSFALLYEETYQKIYFFALTTLKNQEEAERAVHEIYTKILSSINSLRNENHFIPWIYKVAYSVCTRIVSSKQIHLSEKSNQEDNLESHTSKITNEKQKIMAKSVLSLDDSLRSTLLLVYYHNLSPKDIALIMSCPEVTVRRRLKAAKKQLRAVLEKQNQLVLFTTIPISIAMGSAAGSGLFEDRAFAILQNTLEENKFSKDITFTAHGVYKGMSEVQKASSRNFVIGIFAILIISLGGIFIRLDPEIWAIYPSSTSYAQDVSLEFSIKSILPLKTVYLTSNSGERSVLTKVNPRTYRATVLENGTYTAHATSINRKTAEQTIVIDNIDLTPPYMANYNLDHNLLTVELKDIGSGVDFNELYMVSTNRTRLEPTLLSGGKAVFDIAEKNYILFAKDKAGNVLESQINIVE